METTSTTGSLVISTTIQNITIMDTSFIYTTLILTKTERKSIIVDILTGSSVILMTESFSEVEILTEMTTITTKTTTISSDCSGAILRPTSISINDP